MPLDFQQRSPAPRSKQEHGNELRRAPQFRDLRRRPVHTSWALPCFRQSRISP
jgi:hypothetical protein